VALHRQREEIRTVGEAQMKRWEKERTKERGREIRNDGNNPNMDIETG